MQIASFILEIVVGVVITLLLVRYYLSPSPIARRTNISLSIYYLTEWAVIPVKWIPHFYSRELAAIFSAFIFIFLLDVALLSMSGFSITSNPGIALTIICLRSLFGVVERMLEVYSFIILFGVICSLFKLRNQELIIILTQTVSRFLQPYRRFIPPIKKLDFTPLIALIVAQIFIFNLIEVQRRLGAIFS